FILNCFLSPDFKFLTHNLSASFHQEEEEQYSITVLGSTWHLFIFGMATLQFHFMFLILLFIMKQNYNLLLRAWQ
ncbi:hypothetical protein ACJX0J_011868, partial [Zea mays]